MREEVQTSKAAVGRKLLDLPGYVFRVFVTNKRNLTSIMFLPQGEYSATLMSLLLLKILES